jgi:hypothetical protein
MPADPRRTRFVRSGQQQRAFKKNSPWRSLGVGTLAVLASMLPPASAEMREFSIRLAQVIQDGQARVTVPPTIVAQPASQTALQITVGPVDHLPGRSFIRLKGLPPSVSLSEGHAIAPGAWAISLNALPNLQMNVPAGVSGKSDLTVSLVGEDGASLAEASASLIVAPAPVAVPPAEKKAAAPPPANSPPSEPPRAPVLSAEQRESAEKMVVRGEKDLEQGNIALARQFFLRAAEAGLARGALLLAATYDPRELARLRAQGVQANPAMARQWYERARELGAPEAEERLARLGAQ